MRFDLPRSRTSVLRFGAALVLGFYSGLPLLLSGSTLQAWFKDAGMDLASLGVLALLGLPYTLKFLWAPIFDWFRWPLLGRRRGGLVFSQLAVAGVCFALGRVDPSGHPALVAGLALALAFFSASQDIVFDAWRRESFTDVEQGLAASLAVNGYRAGMLLGGAGALWMADVWGFDRVYAVAGAIMLGGALCVPALGEPPLARHAPASLREAVRDPLTEFFSRPRWGVVLLFIVTYKMGDAVAGQMALPFYLEQGFSKTEIGAVAKVFGLGATLFGALLGGVVLLRVRITRALLAFGVLQALSTAAFAALVPYGASLPVLAVVVAFENLSSGLGSAAFVAFMATRCDRRFSATQFALLSSLMGVPRVLLAVPSGWLAESLGWSAFFGLCAVLALPGMALIRLLPAGQTPGR